MISALLALGCCSSKNEPVGSDGDTGPDDSGGNDGDADADGDTDGDTDADTDADGDTDTDADGDTDTDADGDTDTDADGDTDADTDGDTDVDTATDADGDTDTNTDEDTGSEVVIRACVLAASCGAPGPNISVSQCVTEFGKTASRQDDTMLNHLLACGGAASCAEFRSCWGGDLVILNAFMADAECVGNTISVELVQGVTPAQFDCDAIGGQCVGLASGAIRVGCNILPCDGPDPVADCDGVTANGCGGWGEYTSIDCARSGRACRIDDGHAVCVGTGAACDESERVTCAGSVATYCSGGAQATIDCATTKFATGCAAGATSIEPCTAAGNDCDPVSFVGGCNDSTLQLCVDGSIASFDCHSIGFPLCDLPSVGSARCREGI